MLNGHPKIMNFVLYMVLCQQKRQSLIWNVNQFLNWVLELKIRFIIILMATYCYLVDLVILGAKLMFGMLWIGRKLVSSNSHLFLSVLIWIIVQLLMFEIWIFLYLGSCDAPDTTYLQWAADGEHFLTATTAPRLRIGNGYKIFHYSGALLFEKPWMQQEELYEVIWKVKILKCNISYLIIV